jgi:hypothetical protein
LQLDFDVNASRQIQLHQSVHGLVGGIHDVHQTLMGADFELIAGALVDVRGTEKIEALDAGRQGHGTTDDSAGALRGINDLEGGLVDQLVIEGLETDTDLLVLHFVSQRAESAAHHAPHSGTDITR